MENLRFLGGNCEVSKALYGDLDPVASHSNTQSCFEWFSFLNESVESKIQLTQSQTSVSFLMNRLFEWIVCMNDSMTRLIKPARSLMTNQSNSFRFFFKSVQTHFNFYSGVMYIQTITFDDSSLLIKKIFIIYLFFSSCSLLESVRARPTGWEPLV